MADSNPDNGRNTSNEHGETATDQQGKDSSSQDHPLRFSQYAEAIENPLPQIAVESVPEPVSNLEELECDDTASTRPVVQPDDPVDRRSSAVVYTGEEPSRFRKYRTPMIFGLIIAVVLLTGTVVGVVIANRGHGGSGGGGASTTSSSAQAPSSIATSSADISSTTASSTASMTGSPSSTPSQCADTSTYLTSVSFMSIVGGTGYNIEYQAIDDATDCCIYCYTQVSEGCDSWYWTGGFIGTACSMITGWKGSNSDSTCPHGHTTVSFQQTSKNASFVGGSGPCASLSTSSGWSP
ncbi:hypothetical protein VMCG_01787 [Cytospora schulzeri]|uniref:Uncharacterized protein n=1 Tax=Cytospora schulzeri TaxID=448051 RepID=A0A423X358_9PEZI|nr:hypothetical protein VMCG_01787 [Valsa malicola]